MRLTKRTIDALGGKAARFTVWDSEVKGFGLRVTPSGEKAYVLKFRIGTTQRWITIGRHGSPWTPEAARREAVRLLSAAADNNPADRHKRDLGATPLPPVFARWTNENKTVLGLLEGLVLIEVEKPLCGIYILVGAFEKLPEAVLYVGQSVNVQARILGHLKVFNYDKVLFFACAREELNAYEAAFIEVLQPIFNGRYKTGRYRRPRIAALFNAHAPAPSRALPSR